MKRGVLIIISIPFFLVGLLLVSFDFSNLVLNAKTTANDTRLQVQRIKSKALEIDDYFNEFGERPSNKLLACDWQPCPEHFFWLWELVPSKNGNYTLNYLKMSNRFGPFFKSVVVYDSESQTTDHDWFQTQTNVYLYAMFRLLIDVLVMFFPFFAYLSYRKFKHT
ncbi:hypothetical protein [Paraglaciecola sp.]|uniref:hypothetical protein n=1 Tax=Paraglaciecola sp. TaxID=1920173 RepID=UPI00329684F3